MAEVVLHSTQHMTPNDLMAMAHYLKEFPQSSLSSTLSGSAGTVESAEHHDGSKLYGKHCAQCHGDAGQGVPRAYPALADNRAVSMPTPTNLVQIVLNGGFAAATVGNPRPFGMPPFALSLSDQEIAAVLSYIRSDWGNSASEVTPQDVDRLRSLTAQ
jgi:mono/diheme cytochrome c family protein